MSPPARATSTDAPAFRVDVPADLVGSVEEEAPRDQSEAFAAWLARDDESAPWLDE